MSIHKDIQKILREYNTKSRLSLFEKYFNPTDLTMIWYITKHCNFNCPYCFDHGVDEDDIYKYSPEYITACFNEQGYTWHIILTGGEPFLYKSIVELSHLLTEKHYLSINTNLSTDNIFDFSNQIDPKRVIAVNASIHVISRNDASSFNKYIENYLLLQEKGFNIIGSYVVYPELLNRFEGDLLRFKKLGLKKISTKAFIGQYNKKHYPESYSKLDRDLIFRMMSNEIDMPEYHKYKYFKGLKCLTGQKMISMRTNGDIERCMSDDKKLGNFFTRDYKLFDRTEKCNVTECKCPYQGMLYSKNHFLFPKRIDKI